MISRWAINLDEVLFPLKSKLNPYDSILNLILKKRFEIQINQRQTNLNLGFPVTETIPEFLDAFAHDHSHYAQYQQDKACAANHDNRANAL